MIITVDVEDPLLLFFFVVFVGGVAGTIISSKAMIHDRIGVALGTEHR